MNFYVLKQKRFPLDSFLKDLKLNYCIFQTAHQNIHQTH